MLLPLLLTWLVLRRWYAQLGLLLSAGLTLLLPIILLAWMSLLLSTFINPTIAIKVILGVMLGVTVGLIRIQKPGTILAAVRRLVLTIRLSFTQCWTCWIWLIILLPLFAFLLFTHSAQIKSESWYSAGSSWGDLPLHLTYIHHFARQEKLSLVSPIFAQVQTMYPFLFDWYTSLLVRSGSSVQVALICSQWQALVAVVLLVLAVIRQFDRRASVIIFSLTLFIAGGGLGWWYFWGDWQDSSLRIWEFLQHQPWQFTNMSDRSVYFSNIIPDMLLPQRGFIIGLAACLAVVNLFFQFEYTRTRKYFQLGCLLIGLLPLFHFHSFLWISGVWLLFSAYDFWKNPQERSLLAKTFGFLLVLAIPQVWWLEANGVGKHFLRWQVGWMLTENGWPGLMTFSWLMLLNFGLTIFILMYLPFQLKRIAKNNVYCSIIYGYSLLVFIVSLFVSFQPWAYDNLKFMMISYFFLNLFAATLLAQWWKGWRKFLVVLLVLIATVSGALSIVRELFLSSEIATADEVRTAQQLKELMQPGEVTLTAGDHNHLIPMLVGQPVVMGYHGWLWSHGIDTGETAADVARMYSGTAQTPSLLQKYGIRYVFIGERERTEFVVNEEYWANNYAAIYQSKENHLYDVQLKQN